MRYFILSLLLIFSCKEQKSNPNNYFLGKISYLSSMKDYIQMLESDSIDWELFNKLNNVKVYSINNYIHELSFFAIIDYEQNDIIYYKDSSFILYEYNQTIKLDSVNILVD